MPIEQTLYTIAQNGGFIAMGLAGIGFLIGFHELGHFLFCKLFKIRTPSFSIGMGPRILKKRIGETDFVLSAIPLGGYVEIAGAAEVGQGDQAHAGATDDGSFTTKPYYQKLLVMLGGIICNLLFAYVTMSILFMVGVPKSALAIGDRITGINKTPMTSATQIIEELQKHPDESITVDYERNGQKKSTSIKLGSKEIALKKDAKKSIGLLGVEFMLPHYGFTDSIKQGIATTNMIIGHVASAFKNIFARGEYNNLGGPIAVLSDTIKSASRGFKVFFLLLSFISINLAVLNLIPLPIFDGGQILFYTIEAIVGRPIPNKIREYIHLATWFAVIALALYLSFKDIMRMF